MKKARIALLGMGTVGIGVLEVLAKNGGMIRQREGLDIEVRKILVRDLSKKRTYDVGPGVLTDSVDEILNDSEIDVVIEFMGGEDPAFDYIRRALKNGKSVVTANKEVIAKHWDVLEEEAVNSGAGLYFEASVAAGIPIIESLRRSLQANNILKFMGIINGTTNYILTRMTEKNLSFEDALMEAQRLGYAEPDPTADVEGFDARFKLAILSTICFRNKVPLDQIFCEGITRITAEDIEYARNLGYGVKLLAIAKKYDDRIEARVHPTFIPLSHPLYAVREAYNAIYLESDIVGNLMFYGKGAGAFPTASSVLSDIIAACKNKDSHSRTRMDDKKLGLDPNWIAEYYIRMLVADKPGVLAEIAGLFGKNNVSLESVIQKNRGSAGATIIFITHEAHERSLMKAIEEMKGCASVSSIESVIRVEK